MPGCRTCATASTRWAAPWLVSRPGRDQRGREVPSGSPAGARPTVIPAVRRLTWALVVAAPAWSSSTRVVSAQYCTMFSTETLSEHAWPAVPVAALASVVMGALIVSRYPRHPIGWLLAAGAARRLPAGPGGGSLWVTDHGGPGRGHRPHDRLAVPVNASFTLTTLTLIFLIAPDGRLPSPVARRAVGRGRRLPAVRSRRARHGPEVRLVADQDTASSPRADHRRDPAHRAVPDRLAGLAGAADRRAVGVVRQQLLGGRRGGACPRPAGPRPGRLRVLDSYL